MVDSSLQTRLPRFGTLPDGTDVHRIPLSGHGLEAGILSLGATLQSLRFDGRPVVLSHDNLAAYAEPGAYFGAIAGRCANRIAGGRFTLEGKSYDLPRNENGRTHLHGGMKGLSHRPWTVTEASGTSVTLAYRSPDGEEGYPGTLDLTCRYALVGEGVLRIALTATCDRTTVINLATHSYFNLDAPEGGVIDDHVLMIPAEAYLPVDGDKIPTGELVPVAGTPFDFRQPRRVGDFAYDHAFVLAPDSVPTPRPVARLQAGRSGGIVLEIASTEPAVQFYTGDFLGPQARTAAARAYGRRAGLCLEPQRFPDAPNQPSFPSIVLRPGETYRQITEYRFHRA